MLLLIMRWLFHFTLSIRSLFFVHLFLRKALILKQCLFELLLKFASREEEPSSSAEEVTEDLTTSEMLHVSATLSMGSVHCVTTVGGCFREH